MTGVYYWIYMQAIDRKGITLPKAIFTGNTLGVLELFRWVPIDHVRQAMKLNWSQMHILLVQNSTPGGLVVECLPGVREVMGSIPCQVIPKTLKMVLDTSLLLKERSRIYGRFPAVNCKMWRGGMLYQCACDIAFKCGSTISATSRHRHDMTEI